MNCCSASSEVLVMTAHVLATSRLHVELIMMRVGVSC